MQTKFRCLKNHESSKTKLISNFTFGALHERSNQSLENESSFQLLSVGEIQNFISFFVLKHTTKSYPFVLFDSLTWLNRTEVDVVYESGP